MEFSGKVAVITGAGSGIGQELARQLVVEGCSVAICDISAARLEESQELCLQAAPDGVLISTHVVDVSSEEQMVRVRDDVVREHSVNHINLLFNNAGIGGGGSFVTDPREQWERTFAIDWSGVYIGCRVFLPLLVAAEEGHIINTSSINGFWATLGPDFSHTAYSTAKFAVKGFTEALITDLRIHAPHVKCSVVMPGHIGTGIVENSPEVLTGSNSGPNPMIALARATLVRMGVPSETLTDEQIGELIAARGKAFREDAPTTSEQAAQTILEGVKADHWRILVGDDAVAIDQAVRADPENAYEAEFFEKTGLKIMPPPDPPE